MMKKSGGKQTRKYVPISNSDLVKGEVLVPGRHPCSCEATKHDLINNCLDCGRIVCAQEGSGPCFTCKSLVCTPREQEMISRQSKAGFKLYNKLMNLENGNVTDEVSRQNYDSSLKSAIDHRNKLLEYDKTVEKRLKVIDDENDFFQVDNKWLSSKQRKILNEKKEEYDELLVNRQKTKFTLDFAGRKVVGENPNIDIDVDKLLESDTSIFECEDPTSIDIPMDFNPVYEESNVERKRYYEVKDVKDIKPAVAIRIQDRELQEMSDEGWCLSLHQPYASLVISGIKKHEGRVWYTSYRGRLWIHAAGKVPTKREISDIENLYRTNTGNCKFPETYPSGCLIGCVDLVDCLPQEEYEIQFPAGEIASPYVLMCENAHELMIKFPMKGKHKLFKLESNIHLAAKKTIRKSM